VFSGVTVTGFILDENMALLKITAIF